MIGEKSAPTGQARILNGIQKYECFFIFQMDRIALMEGQFKMPEVLEPPDSNYFQEICMIFMINQPVIMEITSNQDQGLSNIMQKIRETPEILLPNSLKKTLNKTNWIQIEKDQDLPKNCLVVIDDDYQSNLNFLLGFIAFKQPNFEKT